MATLALGARRVIEHVWTDYSLDWRHCKRCGIERYTMGQVLPHNDVRHPGTDLPIPCSPRDSAITALIDERLLGTHVHLLTAGAMLLACEDDPVVRVIDGAIVIADTRSEFRITITRQARQLAYQLCEAADALERGGG